MRESPCIFFFTEYGKTQRHTDPIFSQPISLLKTNIGDIFNTCSGDIEDTPAALQCAS